MRQTLSCKKGDQCTAVTYTCRQQKHGFENRDRVLTKQHCTARSSRNPCSCFLNTLIMLILQTDGQHPPLHRSAKLLHSLSGHPLSLTPTLQPLERRAHRSDHEELRQSLHYDTRTANRVSAGFEGKLGSLKIQVGMGMGCDG